MKEQLKGFASSKERHQSRRRTTSYKISQTNNKDLLCFKNNTSFSRIETTLYNRLRFVRWKSQVETIAGNRHTIYTDEIFLRKTCS